MPQRRIAVLNQKGGVGKSTTTVNLAVALASRGLRVLVVDFDAQQNASQFLGLAAEAPWGAAEFLLDDSSGFHPVRDQLVPGLDVITASARLALAERQLLGDLIAGPKRLKKALDRSAGGYDFVLTDCGPTLGLMALNAVVACPEVLVPVELAHASLAGAMTLRKYLADVAMDLEPATRILGVLGTFMDEREATPKTVHAALAAIFGPLLFEAVIHSSSALRDAAGQGRPLVLLDPKSRGSLEYQSLTSEVLTRGN